MPPKKKRVKPPPAHPPTKVWYPIPPLEIPSPSSQTPSHTLSSTPAPLLATDPPVHSVKLPGNKDGGEGLMTARQQKELELLIQELQERDVELNSLVEIQQRQTAVWAEDRQKVLDLERKCLQLQTELDRRNQELSQVKAKLAEVQYTEQESTVIIRTLQHNLEEVESERERVTSHSRTVEARVSGLEERVLQLEGRVREKEEELREAQESIQQVESGRDKALRKLKAVQEAVAQREIERRAEQAKLQRSELALAEREEALLKIQQERERLQTELVTSSAESERLRSEVKMAGECDKRKEQLLQLQRSKLDRHKRELDTLKKMCGHQEQQISSLRNQLRAANKPHPPVPLSSEREEAGSSVVDELTELLERAGARQQDSHHSESHCNPATVKDAAVSTTSRAAVSPLSTPVRAPFPFSSTVTSTPVEPAKSLRPHQTQFPERPLISDPSQQLQLSLTDRQTPPQGWRGTAPEPSPPHSKQGSVTRTRPRHPQRHTSSSSHHHKPHSFREREANREPLSPPPAPHGSWGDSPLGVDLNHLAQEVRERLSSILDPRELSSDMTGHRVPMQPLNKGGIMPRTCQ